MSGAANRWADFDAEIITGVVQDAEARGVSAIVAVAQRFDLSSNTARRYISNARAEVGDRPVAPQPTHGTTYTLDAGCRCTVCHAVRKADVLRRVGHIPGQAMTLATMRALDAIGRPDGMPARRAKFGNSHMLGDLT